MLCRKDLISNGKVSNTKSEKLGELWKSNESSSIVFTGHSDQTGMAVKDSNHEGTTDIHSHNLPGGTKCSVLAISLYN